MSTPSELSFDEILKFMLLHNGKVTNHQLVKHFKMFLVDPVMKDEARKIFKEHVSTLSFVKTQNNEKWLILKKNYMQNYGKENVDVAEIKVPDSHIVVAPDVPKESESISVEPPYLPPPSVQLNQDFNILTNIIQNNTPSSHLELSHSESEQSFTTSLSSEDVAPKVHPRRKSDKTNNNRSSSSVQLTPTEQQVSTSNQEELINKTMSPLTTSRSDSMLVDNEQKISVKERKQMFNRMASEGDALKSQQKGGNIGLQGLDGEDRASLLDQKSETEPLDSKQKQWILCASKGEYHAMAKMCKENPKLVKTKDPFATAMHWACKRGDENLVKLLAGVARHVVNERSGYTPLHIAMQFRHENVYKLLVEVYDADVNVRDWSGKKPRQYLVHTDTSLSPGFRKKDTASSRRPVTSPPSISVTYANRVNSLSKKEGFLRIGSLNVRVKKTTEAFSNFLGVGATRASTYIPKSKDVDRRSDDGDQLHKSWGSADNIQKDDKLMRPPMNSKVRRRGASGRRGLASHSRSTPSTPDQPRAQIGGNTERDSDSDTAAGFHSAWRQQRV